MTTGMWNWYTKHRQGYAPIDTRVDCSLGNGLSNSQSVQCVSGGGVSTHALGGGGGGGNSRSAQCLHGGGAGNSQAITQGWVSPGSRRHFNQQRYGNGGYHPVPSSSAHASAHAHGHAQDSSGWSRANGCSTPALAVSRALTPPPTWTSGHGPHEPQHPAAHRTSTPGDLHRLPAADTLHLPGTQRPDPGTSESWGSSSQQQWSHRHSSGDCLLGVLSIPSFGLSLPLSLSFLVIQTALNKLWSAMLLSLSLSFFLSLSISLPLSFSLSLSLFLFILSLSICKRKR